MDRARVGAQLHRLDDHDCYRHDALARPIVAHHQPCRVDDVALASGEMAADRSVPLNSVAPRAPRRRVWLDRLDRARLAVCAAVLLLTFWLAPGGRWVIGESGMRIERILG